MISHKLRMSVGISLSIALISSISFADPKCLSDVNDPYSEGVTMPAGKHKGECIDTSNKRAVRFLDSDNQTYTFANFRYDKKFWTAKISRDAVKSVEFIFVDLNVKALSKIGVTVFHSHLRFRLSKPLQLIRQGVAEVETAQVDDVIVSLNYIAPKGVGYDPVKGFNEKNYLSVSQIYATQDEMNTRFLEHKVNVYSIPLKINEEYANKAFAHAVTLSDINRYRLAYDTWTYNCTLDAFKILDRALASTYAKTPSPFKFKVKELSDLNLEPALKALKARGLLDSTSTPRLVNPDFGFGRFPAKWNKY